jgi:hypothetical protein
MSETHDTAANEDLYNSPSPNSRGTGAAQTEALIDFSSDSESGLQSPVLIDLSPDHGETPSLHRHASSTSAEEVHVFERSRSSQQDSLI